MKNVTSPVVSSGAARRLACFLVFLVAMLGAGSLWAQCKPGDMLIGEDDDSWLCSSPAKPKEVAYEIDRFREQLLGPQWEVRKRVIDAAGLLAGLPYEWGGKVRVDSRGKVTHVCVAVECAKDADVGIDCSGLAEFAAFAGCFVGGFYKSLSIDLQGLQNNAAGQAEYFEKRKAFIKAGGNPSPGDLIFFKGTVPGKSSITHVGIFLGTTKDGLILIIHASSSNHRVIFDKISVKDGLGKKIAGYGDLSKALVR